MAEELYDTDFPRSREEGFRRTSEPAYYNCIAFVVGDTRRKWWPGEYHPFISPDYWPKTAPNEESLEAFTIALGTAGYLPCVGNMAEPGYEKVALYTADGEIKHAALQQEDGTWRSKLASDEDIEHTLSGLEGPAYGKVVAYLKRPRKVH